MRKQKKTHLRTAIVVSLGLLTLFAAFLIFRNKLYTEFKHAEENHLAESAKAISEIFYIKLDDQLTMLESQARYFQSIDLSDYNAMKETIMATKGIGEFKNIGVANASGATINYNGTSSGNILLTDYYHEAMKGNYVISESTVIDEDGDEVLVLAVPIRKETGVTGVIYGTFTKDTLDSILDSITFSDNSSNMLFNSDGKILAKVSGSFIGEDAETLTDVIPDASAPDDGSSAFFYYTARTQSYIAVMVPIGIHDWYFTNLMPGTIITSRTNKITLYVGVLIVVVITVFLGILLHILGLIRSSDRIADINERFRLVNDQSHNIVFSYNFKDESLTVEGNASHITGQSKTAYSREDAKGFLEQIHPEDMHIRQSLKALLTTDQLSVQGEFRLKNTDGNYYWYRLNATVLRDESGKAAQVLGSLIDVDDQRTKEIQLMEQAYTDSLTGILNKGAFRTQVSKLLEEEPSMLALFIIDLDNFKSVNDNLGHAMGDRVLTDVASKLAEIVGSRDDTGRIGGDEFAAFMIGSDLTEKVIEAHAAMICKQMQKTYTAFSAEVPVSVSVGVALYPANGTDYDTLYQNADSALYKVKNSGKNMYAMYREEESHD